MESGPGVQKSENTIRAPEPQALASTNTKIGDASMSDDFVIIAFGELRSRTKSSFGMKISLLQR
jgi:hypothetical protein